MLCLLSGLQPTLWPPELPESGLWLAAEAVLVAVPVQHGIAEEQALPDWLAPALCVLTERSPQDLLRLQYLPELPLHLHTNARVRNHAFTGVKSEHWVMPQP